MIDRKIILRYDVPTCESCARCMCVKELTYTFNNIEKREYTFEIERIV